MTITLPRIDILIKKARRLSGEEDYNETDYGIPTSFFIEALNDASDLIHLHLVNEKCEPFAAYDDTTISAETESIAVPTDIFSTNLVYSVWYSSDGTSFGDPLEMMYEREPSLTAGYPERYFVDGGRIYFDRKVSSGTYRVRYERSIDKLDVRRAIVSSSTGTLPALATITIDITDTLYYDSEQWTDTLLAEYITLNDRDGNILMRDIPVESYDSSTGVITIDTFTAQSGETVPAGSFVLFGPSSTTHSKLPRAAEMYFKEYLKSLAYEERSQDDVKLSNARLSTFLEQIAEVYSSLPSGFATVPMRRF